MKSLIYRAYDLCTLKEDRDEELEFLKNTFIANYCTPRLVDGIFKKYIPRRHDANYDNTKEEKKEDFEKVLNLPFIKGFSDRVRRDLVKEGVKVVFKKGQTLEKMLCKFRPRIPKELSKNNIYLKNCTGCSST